MGQSRLTQAASTDSSPKPCKPSSKLKTQTELSAQTLKAALKADTNIPDALVNFDRLPNSAFVRLPTVAAWKDISPATVWRWVKLGLLPKPVKIGPNTTAWRVGDLRDATNVGVAA